MYSHLMMYSIASMNAVEKGGRRKRGRGRVASGRGERLPHGLTCNVSQTSIPSSLCSVLQKLYRNHVRRSVTEGTEEFLHINWLEVSHSSSAHMTYT